MGWNSEGLKLYAYNSCITFYDEKDIVYTPDGEVDIIGDGFDKNLNNLMYYYATIKFVNGSEAYKLDQYDSLFVFDFIDLLKELKGLNGDNFNIENTYGEYSYNSKLTLMATLDYEVDVISEYYKPDNLMFHRLHIFNGMAKNAFSCTISVNNDDLEGLITYLEEFVKESFLNYPKQYDNYRKSNTLENKCKKGTINKIYFKDDENEERVVLGEIYKENDVYKLKGFTVKYHKGTYNYYYECYKDSIVDLDSISSIYSAVKDDANQYYMMKSKVLENMYKQEKQRNK